MREMARGILESLIVVVVGTGIALVANVGSDVGLELRRNYFKPVGSRPSVPTADSSATTQPGDQAATRPAVQESSSPVHAAQGSAAGEVANKVEKLVKEAGLTPLRHDEVAALFHDPQYQSDAYVFVDARNEKQYHEGHIPRAWRLDHVNPQLTLDLVQPFLLGAEKIVIYCHGGDCEDSLFTAGYLRDTVGINPAILHVYTGGMEEWASKGGPVEKGERLSGDITTGGAQ